jgi:hypothetical protein
MPPCRLLQRVFQPFINLRGAVIGLVSSFVAGGPGAERYSYRLGAARIERTINPPDALLSLLISKQKKALAEKRPGLSDISTSKTILKIDPILSL